MPATSLKAKFFAQASAFPALQALLGTNPFGCWDGQLDQNALAGGFAAIVMEQSIRTPMYAFLGQLPTDFTRLQLRIYGAVTGPQQGADSQSCDAVVGALQEFLPTFNATGITLPDGVAYPNRIVGDRDFGIADTQPRTFMRLVDVAVFANNNT
jgi:hypothetical protein